MTTLTTDKVAISRSDMCLVDHADGLIHYSVLVEEFHKDVSDIGWMEPPFVVLMCEMIDSYDHATSWADIRYPDRRWAVDFEHSNVPTCVRCMAV